MSFSCWILITIGGGGEGRAHLLVKGKARVVIDLLSPDLAFLVGYPSVRPPSHLRMDKTYVHQCCDIKAIHEKAN